MDGIDSYMGISSASEGLYKDKGSRFIAYAYPVSSESEVKPLVDALKKRRSITVSPTALDPAKMSSG